MCLWGVGVSVWMGVERPCPPMLGDIVTARYIRKLAQVEVCSSICLGDITSQCCEGFCYFLWKWYQLWKTAAPKQIESQNSIWAHFKNSVYSLKRAQVEVSSSFCLEDVTSAQKKVTFWTKRAIELNFFWWSLSRHFEYIKVCK